MASDSPHKQVFRVRDLSTRSVLLFPTRAQVIRDIKEVSLLQGANQIVIEGLDPSVDEHSIKVEGTGSATITEVSIELLANREVYEDIYPSDDEDEETSEDDEEEEEVEEMKKVVNKIKNLNVHLLNKQESINSAAKRLLICDNFGKSVTDNRPPIDEMEALVHAYQVEREKIYSDHEAATLAVEDIRDEIAQAEKEKVKVAKAIVKAKEKQEREKEKMREKKLRKKAEIYKEKQRIRAERESFWPKKVYRVTINLEPTSFTPASSRRNSKGSIDGDTIVNLATSDFHEPSKTPLKVDEVNLSISYITYAASWSPRYDMSLNSVKCTGVLEYGAELKNTSSETWKDAKVILSTSQTTFSGLSETIPILQPWHVRLLRGAGHGESGLFSEHELQSKMREWNQTNAGASQKPRWEIYGKDNGARDDFTTQQVQRKMAKKSAYQANVNQITSQNVIRSAAPFGSAPPAAPAWESVSASRNLSYLAHAMPQEEGSSFGRGGAARHERRRALTDQTRQTRDEQSDDEDEDEDMTAAMAFDNQPQSLSFEEGAWEESGMTTTYEIPAAKTLAPSNSLGKHKISKIEFKSIIFSHIIIGKLRQVAFLKARMRNSSRITLLKGPLGLTLDGSFLGQTSFPRCSSGESFSLPLGVDPSISIAYTKPTVRRSQTGIFNKEDSNVFMRTVVITNTKPNSPAELTVLDQIPVSEDERLKIEIVQPKGLKVGGEGIRTGQNTTAVVKPTPTGSAKDVRASVYGSGEAAGTKWGTAVATTKKGGEVVWNVKLNPGQGVKLVLEYEASFPTGEGVVNGSK